MKNPPLANTCPSPAVGRLGLSHATLAAGCLALTACGGGKSNADDTSAAALGGRARVEAVASGADVVAGRFHVRGVQSGLCLEVTGAGTTNGVNIQQATCADVPQ